MDKVSVDEIIVTSLRRIKVPGGDIMHAIKKGDLGFIDFGEAYFSIIDGGAVKAWKRHSQMTLNIIVPLGSIYFAFFDSNGKKREEIVGQNRYVRLTVPPGIWFGFKGLNKTDNLVSNFADIIHDPEESQTENKEFFLFNW